MHSLKYFFNIIYFYFVFYIYSSDHHLRVAGRHNSLSLLQKIKLNFVFKHNPLYEEIVLKSLYATNKFDFFPIGG